jgi:chromosome segregation ATPase
MSIHRHQCACSCAEELAEITKEVKAERDALSNSLDRTIAEKDALRETVFDMETERNALEPNYLGVKAEINRLRNQLRDTEAERDGLKNANALLEEAQQINLSTIKGLEDKLDAIERQAEDATEYVLATIVKEVKAENARLRELLELALEIQPHAARAATLGGLEGRAEWREVEGIHAQIRAALKTEEE